MLLAVLHRHLGRCVDVKKKKRERMNPQKKLYEQLGLEPLKPRCVAYIPAPKYIHIGVHTTILSRLVVVTK